jgi:glycosyltransferase involved in cell wall biosynthesis
MKIAYIYDVIYPYVKGGAEKRFWELAKRLSLKGHEVHIFGMQSWQGDANLMKEGVYIHGIGRHRSLYKRRGIRNIRQVLYFSFSILVSPPLWKKKFDIIDCNAFPYLTFFPIKLLASLKKIPLVVTWQEVWDKYWYSYLGRVGGAVGRLIERLVIKLSTNIIAHSAKVKQNLIYCGATEDKIEVIPDGVDLRFIEAIAPSSEKNDLIFVGRLIKDKNVDILIKSTFFVKKELSSIKCLIIGDGPEKQDLIMLAEKLNLRDNIVFRGFVEYEEMVSHMKASKIFVFPSTREGFGIVVIEAMACGLPVITVDHPMNAACEFIKDNQNGFICELDARQICQNILGILRRDVWKTATASIAKDSVREYDWNTIAGQNERLYNYAISKIRHRKY